MPHAASCRTLGSLLRDRRGVAGLYFAAALAMMMLLSLAGLDMIRIHLVRSHILASADAALLAAGRSLGNGDWADVGVAYFDANMAGGVMGKSVTITADDFAVTKPTGSTTTIPSPGDTVSLTVKTTLPLLSAGFLDIAALDISVTSTAKTTAVPAEVVMVLDNTGSMDTTKMTRLKSAAKALAKAMVGPNSGGQSYVGLVPYNTVVRVADNVITNGRYTQKEFIVKNWLFGESTYPFSTTEWEGCLFERPDPNDNYSIDSRPPNLTSAKFYAYGKTKYDKTTKKYKIDEDSHDTQDMCKNISPVSFLKNDYIALETSINAMKGNGNTLISSGLLWGWRMLDPAWSGTTGWGSATLPAAFDPGRQKVLVLLTDGENNLHNAQDKTPYAVDISKISFRISGNTVKYDFTKPTETNPKDGRTFVSNICSSIKNDGNKIKIIVVAIGDEMNNEQGIKSMLQGCASSTADYIRAEKSTEWETAFANIGGQLSTLRIIEN